MPTAYYEQTTPYLKSTFPQFASSLDDVILEESNDIFDNNDLDYDDDLNSKNLDNLFDNDDEDNMNLNAFIEAYNPNVKVRNTLNLYII